MGPGAVIVYASAWGWRETSSWTIFDDDRLSRAPHARRADRRLDCTALREKHDNVGLCDDGAWRCPTQTHESNDKYRAYTPVRDVFFSVVAKACSLSSNCASSSRNAQLVVQHRSLLCSIVRNVVDGPCVVHTMIAGITSMPRCIFLASYKLRNSDWTVSASAQSEQYRISCATASEQMRPAPPRALAACLRCKIGKLKCDDTRPGTRCQRQGCGSTCLAYGSKSVEDLRRGSSAMVCGEKQRSCEGCRRRKIRCSKGRPCSHCGVRNLLHACRDCLGGITAKRACLRCRLSKVGCDDSRPCSRCARAAQTCSEPPRGGVQRSGRASSRWMSKQPRQVEEEETLGCLLEGAEYWADEAAWGDVMGLGESHSWLQPLDQDAGMEEASGERAHLKSQEDGELDDVYSMLLLSEEGA
ncbi:hypothetical protein GUITHDRAFT_120646 [Guillardia theta CCMP2712]|uniref:Zn(2)-C6 fungal-type domain-containing protein n=1 Tax=Guillardia theta (strain CCMP2712) TaxID=905079 RepID=L1IA79_GUITC|nr:hypothetical protein GUITHDRAFT_120646 [Guillardia theta CCMP2712]EKX33166.1 hypothetical protein GUITHDRAFT_120646 [Guillardia theta CCMP2712]|eukprot:XP_005820146.1 hypothetical protein GUITHDRAFT_120646 [Guillardia theta CCMP2712]